MIYRALFTLWVAVCTALPALAAELEFSAGGEVEYDDNVFRSEHDKEDDVLFRLRPGVRVYEDRGDDLNFSAGYEAPAEFSVDNPSEINDVDHIGRGRFNYHVNDRIEVFGDDRYGYLRSTVRNRDDLEDSNDILDINDERDRVTINDASLGGSYKFSERTVARVVASSRFFDSTREDRARVWSLGGTSDLNYSLTMKHQVGAGLSYTYQDFDDREDISGSQTHSYEMFGSWRWLIDPTLTLDLRAGPAYLQTRQDDADQLRVASTIPFQILPAAQLIGFSDSSGAPLVGPGGGPAQVSAGSLLLAQPQNCSVIDGTTVSSRCAGNIVLDAISDSTLVGNVLGASTPVVNIDAQGDDDDTFTGFAEIVLTKTWLPTFNSALSYSREQGDASGLGGTVIVDAVSLSNTWNFAENWSVALRGDYVRRESAFDINQTYDQVTGQPIPGGPNPFLLVATRTGFAFNATEDADIDTDRYGMGVRVTHRLFRSTSLYGQLRYDRQDSKSDSLGSGSDFDVILATFGVRHVFEPIPLW
jgi:hypothetical protein